MEPHVLPTYVRSKVAFVAGDGAVLRTADGGEALDFFSGIAVSALGHAHPALTEALRDQVGALLHTSNLFPHPYSEAVANRLAALTGLAAVFFANSGAEANEAALKIARKYQRQRGAPQRTAFVALEGGFHGRTMGALSVTAHAPYREPFAPLVPDTHFVPFADRAALEQALATAPAALILEPIQGESGIRPLPDDYLRAARRLCDDTGTVLIHDEVQSGCGRTGTFLAAEHADVRPDIATLAKPLAAGLPLSATVVAAPLRDVLQPGDHGSTFGGGPLACRAATVFLAALEGGLQDAVVERGAQLRRGLERLAAQHPCIDEVRGRGLMLGIALDRDAGPVQRTLLERGVVANATAGNVLRFLPPYVITAEQIDRGLAILDGTLAALPENAS